MLLLLTVRVRRHLATAAGRLAAVAATCRPVVPGAGHRRAPLRVGVAGGALVTGARVVTRGRRPRRVTGPAVPWWRAGRSTAGRRGHVAAVLVRTVGEARLCR